MNFYKVEPFKVFLKSKEALLKLGYEDNDDQDDFLNLMSGHVVTINYESEDGKVFISKEFPNNAIYDYLIGGIITKGAANEEMTLTEIGLKYNVTAQAISSICRRALKKMKAQIVSSNSELNVTSASF